MGCSSRRCSCGTRSSERGTPIILLLNAGRPDRRRVGCALASGGRTSLALQRAADITWLCTQREQRPDQQIDRNRLIARLHFRNPRLAGFQPLRELALRQAVSDAPRAQRLAECQTSLDQSGFLRAQAEKVLRGADAPAARFQSSALRLVHVTPSPRRRSAAISSETPQ